MRVFMKFKHFIAIIALLSLTTQSFAAKIIFSKNNLPLAENYITNEVFKGKPKPVDLNSHPKAKEYRTRLKEEAAKGPNFAGHYTLVSIGCGTMCSLLWVIDAKSGKILKAEMLKNHETPEDIIGTAMGEKFDLNSRLLITNPPEEFKEWEKIPDWAETRYYVLEDNKMKEIFSIPTSEIVSLTKK